MQKYCPSLTKYKRWKTREVMVGDIGVGGTNPIRIQSMTTTDTMDTNNTVAQSIRMIENGCEIVRITAPSIKEAKNLRNIQNRLRSQGYKTPIVADIHFTPHAAEIAATIVDKVRINPGNYADRKKFEKHDYSDKSYQDELERIQNRFKPFIKICKENGTSMRIGTNHGSLSDRIMSRYGDTPLGMVESAMEFIRIAEDESFYDIILSMKASNTQVMVQAYRLLVNKMIAEGMNYPLHLGVTEAGEGEDGRIKSSVGIGCLLEDGLGDTVRVSLTEEPEEEMPVARMLVDRYSAEKNIPDTLPSIKVLPYDPFFYSKRITKQILNIGGKEVPRIIGDLSYQNTIKPADLGQFGYLYSEKQDKWHISDLAVDYLYIGSTTIDFALPSSLNIIYDAKQYFLKDCHYPIFSVDQIKEIPSNENVFLYITDKDKVLDDLKLVPNCILVLESNYERGFVALRRFIIECIRKKIKNPIIIKINYETLLKEELLIHSSIDFGGLQIDGLGDGIWLKSKLDNSTITEMSFGILQASRTRISKTEYISCPSCGRTLFDLQETTAKIRARTDHLKGVKIGIMGCIVNGPGEMADADYGYVGTGPGLISLYKGQEIVKKNIEDSLAVDALIDLIKSSGDWVEPTNV